MINENDDAGNIEHVRMNNRLKEQKRIDSIEMEFAPDIADETYLRILIRSSGFGSSLISCSKIWFNFLINSSWKLED